MNVTVNYTGQIAQALACQQESVPCPEPLSLEQFLQNLVSRHGEQLRRFVLDPTGATSRSLLITVNECMVHTTSPQKLQAGDEVTLLPPISGG